MILGEDHIAEVALETIIDGGTQHHPHHRHHPLHQQRGLCR